MRLLKRFKIYQIDNWIVSYVLITLICFITSFSLQMINTGIPIYCIDIGKSTAEAGIFAGFYSFAVIVSGLFVGRIIDSHDKYNIACLGLGLFCLSIIGKAFLPILFLFVLYQIIQGFSYSLSNSAQSAILLDILPNSKLTRGIGYYSVIKSLSYSLGSSFAVTISEKYGTSRFFLITLIIASIALILNLIMRSTKYKKRFETFNKDDVQVITNTEIEEYDGINKFIEIKTLSICLIQILFTFSLTLVTSYLPSYTKTIGLLGISIYYTFNALTMFVTRMFFSKQIERIGNFKSVMIGIILGAITTLAVIFTSNLTVFAFIAIFNAIGITLVNPTLNIYATKDVPLNRRGVASSTYYTSLDLGSGAGGMIWGLLIPLIDYKYSFILATLILIINLFISYIILGIKEN